MEYILSWEGTCDDLKVEQRDDQASISSVQVQ